MSTIIYVGAVVVILVGGFVYYQKQQNTPVEVSVGGSTLSIEKK